MTMTTERIRMVDLSGPHGAKLAACRDRIADLLALGQVSGSYADHVATSFRQFAESYRGGDIETEFIRWLAARSNTSAASTVRFLVSSIGALMRDAGVVSEGAHRILRRRKSCRVNKAVAMSDEQLARVLAWPGSGTARQKLQQNVLLRVLAATGMRLGEALALRCGDLALTTRAYEGHMRPALRIRYDVAKQRTPRAAVTWCPLDDEGLRQVRTFLAMPRPQDALFLHPDGRRLTRRSVQHWLGMLKVHATEQGMHAHAMRHRLARKVQEIYGEAVAKLVLGHSMQGAAGAYLNPPDTWEPLARITYGTCTDLPLDGMPRSKRRRGGRPLRLITCGDSPAAAEQIPESGRR